MTALATTPMAESVRTADLLPRIPAPRVPVIAHTEGVPPLPAVRPVASPALSGALLTLSLRGWPTGTDYSALSDEDEAAEGGCAYCGWAYAAHERGEHRFCGRHLHLVEA